jgi:iron(III) transport system substrate-binding protein
MAMALQGGTLQPGHKSMGAALGGRETPANLEGELTMTLYWMIRPGRVCIAALVAAFSVHAVAQAEPKVGRTLAEIVDLAKKEPTVQLATSWDGEIIDYAVKGFKEKFGLEMEYVPHSGIESRERIFNESLAGTNEMDLVNMSSELADQFVAAGLVVPIDWTALFPGIKEITVSPGKHYLVTGWNQYVLVYNKNLVAEADAPRDWEDCLDPKWKGRKLAVITRPLSFLQTFFKWGEEKALNYHRALRAQDPVWMSSGNSATALLAAGEFSIMCGAPLSAVKSVVDKDPSGAIGIVIPRLFPIQPGESLTLMADSNSPNAAILLAGYLATDGAPGYDLFGRANPTVEGTMAYDNAKAAGAEPYWAGWESSGDAQADAAKKIVEAWGFPKGD